MSIDKSVALIVLVPNALRVRVKVAAARGNSTITRIVTEALNGHLTSIEGADNVG